MDKEAEDSLVATFEKNILLIAYFFKKQKE